MDRRQPWPWLRAQHRVSDRQTGFWPCLRYAEWREYQLCCVGYLVVLLGYQLSVGQEAPEKELVAGDVLFWLRGEEGQFEFE